MTEKHEKTAVIFVLIFFWMFVSFIVWFVTWLVLFFYFEQNPAAEAEEIKDLVSRAVMIAAPVILGLVIFWRKNEPEYQQQDEYE